MAVPTLISDDLYMLLLINMTNITSMSKLRKGFMMTQQSSALPHHNDHRHLLGTDEWMSQWHESHLSNERNSHVALMPLISCCEQC